ncbi:lysophospholipid acyltransferase family protein [Pendulispora albinea]|uniref:Acyltransferase family protein n=1 Tax=Pendulispora albinea TaxID=2741071 RepID=A0ABZ2LNK1_9BACT
MTRKRRHLPPSPPAPNQGARGRPSVPGGAGGPGARPSAPGARPSAPPGATGGRPAGVERLHGSAAGAKSTANGVEAHADRPRKRRRRRKPGAPASPSAAAPPSRARSPHALRTGAKPLRERERESARPPQNEEDDALEDSMRFIPRSPSSVPPAPSVRHETLEFGDYPEAAAYAEGALDDDDLEDDDGYGEEDEEDETTPTIRRPRGADEPELVAEQIRELEARLDAMIDQASTHVLPPTEDDADDDWRGGPRGTVDDTDAAPTVLNVNPSLAPGSARSLGTDGEPTVFDTARELLSTDYYLRKWGRLGMRNRSEEIDDFGYDPVYDAKVRPLFDFLYDRYFRVETQGAGNIPAEGRCLLVANHSGTLPYDGAMIKTAVKREHPQHRDVRWLAEDFIFHFPFLGSFTNRIGAVRACQENAERLLRQEALVAVFPEGVKGIGKLYRDRYRLQRFGRGGFIKLCLRTNTPIVPCVVVGAEEANPMLMRLEYLARVLGVPYIPVTPTFPLLGPAGLAPAPTKWKIVFGELLDVASYGPEAADDELLVGRLAERVRTTIQEMLERALGERKSVFFG